MTSSATLEKPLSGTETSTHPGTAAASSAQTAAARTSRSAKPVLIGFDLGTNKSCVLAGPAGTTDIAVSKILPTLVGYVKEGIVEGIIAGGQTKLFGDDALRYLLHVDAVAPLDRGVIVHRDAARDFLAHIRSLADPSGQAEIRAVIGVPANAEAAARDDIRTCATGIFDRILP